MWEWERGNIVLVRFYAKFAKTTVVRQYILATGDRCLAEAGDNLLAEAIAVCSLLIYDTIRRIGHWIDETSVPQPSLEPGLNLPDDASQTAAPPRTCATTPAMLPTFFSLGYSYAHTDFSPLYVRSPPFHAAATTRKQHVKLPPPLQTNPKFHPMRRWITTARPLTLCLPWNALARSPPPPLALLLMRVPASSAALWRWMTLSLLSRSASQGFPAKRLCLCAVRLQRSSGVVNQGIRASMKTLAMVFCSCELRTPSTIMGRLR